LANGRDLAACGKILFDVRNFPLRLEQLVGKKELLGDAHALKGLGFSRAVRAAKSLRL